jgi:DNA-binding MarR family transcriptional regulator
MADSLPRRQHAVNTERTPAGSALTNVLVEAVRLGELFRHTGETLARSEGQTLARWLVLETLEDEPEPVAEIARRLRLARQSVQRVADLLEHDGLVAYEENPRHRRAKLARLTPAGRRVLGRIQQAQREWADEHGAEAELGDLEQAERLLQGIRETLTRAGSGTSPST